MKKVTAIITTHNRLNDLKRAIDSVLNQTYSHIECIVVSDNSTDGTNDYCENRKDVLFINIGPEESKGGNYARNRGIDAATGEYIAFLDDDDYWLPEKIEKQVELLEEKNCECVYCTRIYENVNNGIVEWRKPESDRFRIEGSIKSKVFRHGFTSTSCILATKSVLQKVGCFDENLIKMQEFELLVRLAQVTEIYCYKESPQVIYTINVSDDNRISNKYYRLPIARKFIETKHSKLLKEANFIDRFLFKDWMRTALFRHALRERRILIIIKYLPYTLFSYLFHKYTSVSK